MGYVDKIVKYRYKNYTLRSYCIKNNISYISVVSKIKNGMSIEEAIRLTKLKYIKYEKIKDLSYIAEEYRKKWNNAKTIEEKRMLKNLFFKLDANENVLSKYWEDVILNKKQKNIKQVEIWKTTKENPKYQVSNFGRFRRVNETSTAKYTSVKPYNHNRRCRKNGPTKKVLFVNLGSKAYLAKKVIANAFLENPNNYTCVLQLDNDYKNINVNNLKWVSASYIGKITGYKSKSIPVEVITKNKEIKKYRSVRNCAKNMNVSYQTILDYLNKKVKNPMFTVRYATFKELFKVGD